MKLSRIILRKKYRRDRRHIDRRINLFADGEAVKAKLFACEEPVLTEGKSPVEGTHIPPRKEPNTVREAFEAFKKSQQNM